MLKQYRAYKCRINSLKPLPVEYGGGYDFNCFQTNLIKLSFYFCLHFSGSDVFLFFPFFDYIGHKQYSAQIGHSSSYHRNPIYEILHTNGGSVVVSNNMYLSKLRCIIKMCPIKTLLLKTKICWKLSRFGIVCTQKCRNLPFTVFNTNKYQAKSYPCSHHCALSTWWCTRFAFNDNFLTFFHSLCSSLFELCLSNQWEALSKQERVIVTFHTWIQLNFNNDTNKKNKWWNERMA